MEQIIDFLKNEITASSARITAARIGISHTYLLKLVSGGVKNPGLAVMEKVVAFQGKPYTIKPE